MTFANFARRSIIAGLIALAPLGLTIWILFWLFNTFNGWVEPVNELWSLLLPDILVGPASTMFTLFAIMLVTFLIGSLLDNSLGRFLTHMFDKLFTKVPLAGAVYATLKEVFVAIFKKRELKSVVLVQYPRRGLYALGFVTGNAIKQIQALVGEPLFNVFIPTAPNPTSGMFVMVPDSELIRLKMPVEQGLKLVISGGFTTGEGIDAEYQQDKMKRLARKRGQSVDSGIKVPASVAKVMTAMEPVEEDAMHEEGEETGSPEVDHHKVDIKIPDE